MAWVFEGGSADVFQNRERMRFEMLCFVELLGTEEGAVRSSRAGVDGIV